MEVDNELIDRGRFRLLTNNKADMIFIWTVQLKLGMKPQMAPVAPTGQKTHRFFPFLGNPLLALIHD